MDRRHLMKLGLGAASLSIGTLNTVSSALAAAGNRKVEPANERRYMTQLLHKMATPVLNLMAKGQLKQEFPIELSPTWDGRNKNVAYMECFGRLMAGLAPWLSLPEDSSSEGSMRKQLTSKALQSFTHSVDPNSPDYLLWSGSGQALVDSAFFTNALIRAPKQLWEPLDATTKSRIIKEIKALRRVSPPYSNWLLFAAMNEVFLLMVGEDWHPLRIDLAIKKINEWYAGDGWFADGEIFHFDYYNAYVIQPMMLEIVEVLEKYGATFNNLQPAEIRLQSLKRMQRFSEHLERFISPSGTYPPIGRSLTYRTAAFQPLALLAWRKALPDKLPVGQVRAAMTAVHQAIFSNASNFSNDGFLTIGFAGHQPGLGDSYSNNGSMYITTASFLALGLPADDAYWTAPAAEWTQKKAFANHTFPKDYAVSY